MKKTKRLLTMLLAVAMILTFMPAMAFAGEDNPEPQVELANAVTLNILNSNNGFDDSDFGDDCVIESTDATKTLEGTSSVLKSYRRGSQGNRTYYASYGFSVSGPANNTWKDAVVRWTDGNRANEAVITDMDADTIGCTGTFEITEDAIKTALAEGGTGKVEKTLKFFSPATAETPTTEVTISIDVSNLDFFDYDVRNNPSQKADPENLRFYSKDGEIKYTTGFDVADRHNNREAWLLDKSSKTAEELASLTAAADKALSDAKASSAAAETAVNTPGDAAVAATKKAVEDNNAALAAIDALNKYKNSLSSLDSLYLENAGDEDYYNHSDVTDENKAAGKQIGDNIAASDKICETTTTDEVNEALKRSKELDAQAKAENAEKKAEQAAAEAAALRFTPVKAKIKSVKPGKKKVTVSFNKISSNVAGYEIQVIDKKSGEVVKTVNVAKSNKKVIKKTVKGLNKKTKYKVQVRAYNAVNGVTYPGAWSKAKSFKTKK